jgi:GTP-binding protein EngB required for normal cell division
MISQKEAWKRVYRVIARSDVIVEVLDARAPEASRIEKIEKIAEVNGKALVLAINKVDLVPYSYANFYLKRFSKEYPTVLVSVKNRWGSRKLRKTILQATEKRPVIVSIVGYPNVGKSSLINMLRGRRVAGVSSAPGFTRGEQLIRISKNIYLYDTPGVVVPSDVETLALLGAYPVEKLRDPVSVARSILEKVPASMLKQVYGVTTLEELSQKMNSTLEDAARKLLRDWYRGKLGLDFQRAPSWKRIRALFHPARYDIEEYLREYRGPLVARELYYYLKSKIPFNVKEVAGFYRMGDYVIAVLVKPRYVLEMKKWIEQEMHKELGDAKNLIKVEEFGFPGDLYVIVYRVMR